MYIDFDLVIYLFLHYSCINILFIIVVKRLDVVKRGSRNPLGANAQTPIEATNWARYDPWCGEARDGCDAELWWDGSVSNVQSSLRTTGQALGRNVDVNSGVTKSSLFIAVLQGVDLALQFKHLPERAPRRPAHTHAIHQTIL